MTSTELAPAQHVAKFSKPLLDALWTLLDELVPSGPLLPASVLDPFAGVGGVHSLARNGCYQTTGVELEPLWACAHPRTIVGDATALLFDPATFDAVVTSPTYGNRLADTYDGGRDTCTNCQGSGKAFGGVASTIERAIGAEPPDCDVCTGTGYASSTRYTYTTSLGQPLQPNNSGAMQWGPKYRALHRAAWAEVERVLKPSGLFFLNISDHYRKFALQGVDLWHANVCGQLGFDLIRQVPVATQRQGNGENRELRDTCEWILVFRKPEL